MDQRYTFYNDLTTEEIERNNVADYVQDIWATLNNILERNFDVITDMETFINVLFNLKSMSWNILSSNQKELIINITESSDIEAQSLLTKNKEMLFDILKKLKPILINKYRIKERAGCGDSDTDDDEFDILMENLTTNLSKLNTF